MFLNILLITFGLFYGVHTKTIVFPIQDIQCNDVFHEYNQYYGSPCIRWKTEMSSYFNYVTCTIAETYSGEPVFTCTPTFGKFDDRINVTYTMKKKCTDFDKTCNVATFKEQYVLHADVSLNRPLHPYLLFLDLALNVCIFLYVWKYYGMGGIGLGIAYFMRDIFRQNPYEFRWLQLL